jgi:hypothetical protein
MKANQGVGSRVGVRLCDARYFLDHTEHSHPKTLNSSDLTDGVMFHANFGVG